MEQQDALGKMLATIPDAIIVVDHKTGITHMNPVASELTGWSEEAARGAALSAVFTLTNGDTPALTSALINDADDEPSHSGREAILQSANGPHYTIRYYLSPRNNRRGRNIGYTLTFRDISEQPASDQALNELLDNAVISMSRVDGQGIIRGANQAELNMLGYSAEEYIGHPISDFHVDKSRAQNMLDRLAQGETLRDFPTRLRRKDGVIDDVLISSKAHFIKGEVVNRDKVLNKDKMAHSLFFSRVVTADKQKEDSHALLAAIVAASDDIIISKSLDGIVRSWNTAAERLLGYSEAEMLGRPINIIIPPEFRDEEAAILARIRSGDRVEHFDTVRITKSKKRIELSLTVSPIFDERGLVVGASKVARDISAQKRSERALIASEERFRRMADSAPVLIWMAGPDKRTHWFNRRWLDFTGRPIKKEIGFGWTEGLHPDEWRQVLRSYRRQFNQRQPYTMEHRLRRADGEYRWLLVNGMPLNADNEFSGYIGSCVDITDRKQAEETILVEDRRKTEFIATLAHELRNPLAPIRNSLEILKNTDYDPKLWNHSHDIIERQLIHMVRLVDDLLNISRISEDKLALRTERVELSKLVSQAVETVQGQADDCGHTLRVRFPQHPIQLQADPVRLTQVLSNLLSNACKFTPPGGDIALSVRQNTDDVTISVKDSGIGIAPDQIDSVFELFQQSNGSLDRAAGGLGIGLTLAKRLVEMHGGTITVNSAGLGHGTEFIVNLPVMASSTIPVRVEPTQQHSVPSQRILVVDDNQDSAETLAILLRLEEHTVQLAYDGLEALQEAEAFRPQVVFLDIGLPKLDGFEVCRRLRAQPWSKNISIIALTGWGQEEDRRKSRAAGFDEHLVKPVSHEALMQVLAQHSGAASEQPSVLIS